MTETTKPEPSTDHGVGVDADVMRELLINIYNCGYNAGHHDTVEGGYVDIVPRDMNSYHADVVDELVRDLTAPTERGLCGCDIPSG